MKVSIEYLRSDRTLRFIAASEDGDITEKFSGDPVFFRMPEGWVYEDLHADILAVAAITILHPFVGSRLQIPVVVSEEFEEACKKLLPYRCDFKVGDARPSPRQPGDVPGLSFSGGVDSTAALAVMPKDTKVVFLDRLASDGSEPAGLYVKDSAEYACRVVASAGYDVFKIKTNLEYIRNPVGFPIDWSSGVPAILLADFLSLSSVSWGVVAESGYRVGHDHFIDFPKRTIFARWDGLFRAVGLCLGAPVAGLSEVATSLIVQKSALAGVAQSCIRGEKNQPCMNCFKCLRKSMLDAALLGETYRKQDFDRVIRFRGGEKIVLGLPIKHENVFRWTISRLRVDEPSQVWDAFKHRLETPPRDVSWAGAWYSPSVDLIPIEFRQHALDAIRGYVPSQNEYQLQEFRSWDLRNEFSSPEMTSSVEALSRALSSPAV